MPIELTYVPTPPESKRRPLPVIQEEIIALTERLKQLQELKQKLEKEK